MSVKSNALTTAERVADYAGLGTLTGTKLTVMENIINSVSDFIENYTGVIFKETTYTHEEYSTERTQTLNLKHYPISTTADFLFERRTSALNNDDWETVDSQYYHVNYTNGIIESVYGAYFAVTIKGYRVTYTAGYDFDNSSTFLSDTDAGDVELATWMLCEAIYNRRKGGSGVRSERIGDYSVTYTRVLMENEDIKAILDKYSLDDTIGVITPSQI